MVNMKYTKKELLAFLNWVSKREDSLTYFIKTRGLKDLDPWLKENKNLLIKSKIKV